MKLHHFTVSDEGGPAYLRIADGIRTAIQRGQLVPGEKLPSSRRLAQDLGEQWTLMNGRSPTRAI